MVVCNFLSELVHFLYIFKCIRIKLKPFFIFSYYTFTVHKLCSDTAFFKIPDLDYVYSPVSNTLASGLSILLVFSKNQSLACLVLPILCLLLILFLLFSLFPPFYIWAYFDVCFPILRWILNSLIFRVFFFSFMSV